MSDDPSVKEILSAASGIPKKVGKSLLETKIPVSKVKNAIEFVTLHWASAVLSLAVLVGVALHYVSQMDETRYMCSAPRATFTLPYKPGSAFVIRKAIEISPVSQAISAWQLNSNDSPYDPNFDVIEFLKNNDEYNAYGSQIATAHNVVDAKRLFEYNRGQTFARCISNNSWHTMVVIFSHALLAYFFFLAVVPIKRRTSAD